MTIEFKISWLDDDIAMYRDTVIRFVESEMLPQDAIARARGHVGHALWRRAGEVGLLCSDIPEAYGGGGGDFRHEAVFYDAMARRGLTGMSPSVHSIVAHYLLNHGTEVQKQRYLPQMARGELVGAIAMTEPGTGSDLQAVRTRAERRGDGYVINGAKTFITNGYLAGLVLVVAKTDPTQRARGTSILIVETAHDEGFRVGRVLDKIGLKAQDTSELFFDDVTVPADRLLGGVEGHGFFQLMSDLPYERTIIGVMAAAAIEGAQRRGSQFRDALHELLTNGTIRIETSGAIVGQVNAISVLSDGPVAFGRPCRVTAVVYPGNEGAMNIAREVEMSGPIHSKGVLVLNGFLASRFAQRRPLSFSASLVFEQTYEAIDGDSASSSELYALLSALSGVPLRQDFAVTGSVDQSGSVQPVGGLNEKIEAFFDVCQAKGGLTGTQGVLIPPTNVDALMLRQDVVDAIAQHRFHVYVVNSVEEGVELLTGVPAGTASGGNPYPEGSVFARVEATLGRFYEALLPRRGQTVP